MNSGYWPGIIELLQKGLLLLNLPRLQIQGVNKTNFMSVSREFINSYERFKNKKVLQDMLNDLFDAVKATISPITVNNVALALEFSEVRNVSTIFKCNYYSVLLIGQSEHVTIGPFWNDLYFSIDKMCSV